jgi:hypothetical protein
MIFYGPLTAISKIKNQPSSPAWIPVSEPRCSSLGMIEFSKPLRDALSALHAVFVTMPEHIPYVRL